MISPFSLFPPFSNIKIAMCLFLTYFLGASEERLKKLLVWYNIMHLICLLLLFFSFSNVFFVRFHITCWGLSAVVAAVPFMGNKYGRIVEDNNWCWIRGMYYRTPYNNNVYLNVFTRFERL